MPAKLDLTKPLRIIGIQIYDGTHLNVRKVLEPGWYPFIKCDNEGEMGTSKTTFPIPAVDGCPRDHKGKRVCLTLTNREKSIQTENF